ncbi:hypothetical protein ACLB1Q_07255 [Escherichia coli]
MLNRIWVEKSQSNFLLIAAVYDTTDKASSSDIADWLVIMTLRTAGAC